MLQVQSLILQATCFDCDTRASFSLPVSSLEKWKIMLTSWSSQIEKPMKAVAILNCGGNDLKCLRSEHLGHDLDDLLMPNNHEVKSETFF